jgi:hypothetical protein
VWVSLAPEGQLGGMTSFPETDRHLAGGVAGNGRRRAEEQEGEVVGLNDVGGG